ncbi:MAG: hypothetical protein KF694_22305 [Mesorhizobium sp.]|nr:hypothetical protein [Mesorhizobium sp.]
MATRMLLERFRVLGMWEAGEEFRSMTSLKSAWSTDDEHVIAGVYFIEPEAVFTYILLVRDKGGRYRGFFMANPALATARLADASVRADLRLIETGEKPAPVLEAVMGGIDLFAHVVEKPNEKFVNLRNAPQPSATRGVMAEVARWYDDLDGNFVKDFQSTGFDARVWELYLFAAFTEMGLSIDRSKAIPDFRLSRGERKVFVEAVTANPSHGQQFSIAGAPPPPPEDFAHYMEHEMPQKFGSPLRSKLAKRYWLDPDVAGHPFVLALADFHSPASMTWSHTALSFYLYGVGVELREGHPNYKKSIEKPLGDHVVGRKVVPTNFFAQEEHRYVSAILFSNAGTTAKFNRMGVLAGYGDPSVKLRRIGALYNHELGAVDPVKFEIDVEDPDYDEEWSDEIEVYHNPNARLPLALDLFPHSTHFLLENGELVWRGPERRVLFSITHTLHTKATGVAADAVAGKPVGPESPTEA